MEDIDCEGTEFVTCPYCGNEDEIEWEDMPEYNDESDQEHYCGSCDKSFYYTTYWGEPTFTSEKNEEHCKCIIESVKKNIKYYKNRQKDKPSEHNEYYIRRENKRLKEYTEQLNINKKD